MRNQLIETHGFRFDEPTIAEVTVAFFADIIDDLLVVALVSEFVGGLIAAVALGKGWL